MTYLTDLSKYPLPRRWPAERKKAWRDLVAELPLLTMSHVALLEVASEMRARDRAGYGGSDRPVYLEVLRLLGATPIAAAGTTIIMPEA